MNITYICFILRYNIFNTSDGNFALFNSLNRSIYNTIAYNEKSHSVLLVMHCNNIIGMMLGG